MLCPNHKVSKFTASHNSNLSHDWNDIQVIIDRRPLRDFVARAPTSRSAYGGALNDEISHAERVFSLLLAGGALAHAMKLTAGGRGSFTFEGLYRSELLTAFKCKSPARCAELHDVLRRGRDSNSWYGKPVRQFSKLVVSATHPPLRKCIPSRDSLTDFS